MLKRTLHYLWGKKFILLLIVLVVLLLPGTLTRQLQVRTTNVLTEMTIDASQPTLQITARKFKSTPGESSLTYEDVTFQGTEIRTMLKDVSLAHCRNIKFNGEINLDILWDLYDYHDLRANTTVNGDQTIDEILKSQYYRYPRSSASAN